MFTLETDYPSEIGYLLDFLRETDYSSSSEKGTVLILDEQSTCLYPSAYPSILTDSADGLSVSSVRTASHKVNQWCLFQWSRDVAEVLTGLTFHLQSFPKTVDSFVELLLSLIQKTPDHEMKTQICAVCIIHENICQTHL